MDGRVGTRMSGIVTITDLVLLQRLFSIPRKPRHAHHPAPSLPHRLARRTATGRYLWAAVPRWSTVISLSAPSICSQRCRIRFTHPKTHDESSHDVLVKRKHPRHILRSKRSPRCTSAHGQVLPIKLRSREVTAVHQSEHLAHVSGRLATTLFGRSVVPQVGHRCAAV